MVYRSSLVSFLSLTTGTTSVHVLRTSTYLFFSHQKWFGLFCDHGPELREIDLIWEHHHHHHHHSCDRNWLGFWVRVEKYLGLVCGSKLTCFLCGGIEIDLLHFRVGIELTSIAVASKIVWFLWVRDRIWLGFGFGIENDLFVRGIEIDGLRAEKNCF